MKLVFLTAIAALSISCSTVVVENSVKKTEMNRTDLFFSTFEKDMKNSAKIILEQDLIKTLTHFQKMDIGGTKYYPLEREGLTRMINELVSYKYSECILLNSSGVIIYSMYEDKLLSKRSSSFPDSIGPVFTQSKGKDSYISDTVEFPRESGKTVIFVGKAIYKENEFLGVLIGGMDAGTASDYALEKGQFINSDGIVMLSKTPALILKKNESEKSKERYTYGNLNWFFLND